MVDRGDDVRLLATGQHKRAVQRTMGRLSFAAHGCLVSHRSATQQEHKAGKPRGGPEYRQSLAEMQSIGRLLDEADPGKLGSGGEPQLDDIVAPIAAVAGEGLEDRGATVYTK